jgi:hypothetical protein
MRFGDREIRDPNGFRAGICRAMADGNVRDAMQSRHLGLENEEIVMSGVQDQAAVPVFSECFRLFRCDPMKNGISPLLRKIENVCAGMEER